MENLQQYFRCLPGTPPIGVPGDYRCSVHFGNTYRLDKAKEQVTFPPADVDVITAYVNDFLEAIGMNAVEFPTIELLQLPLQINYKKIQADHALREPGDIVWMKFTKDGYLGVVATSDDINFDIPSNASEYDKKEWQYNFYRKEKELVWKHNSAGILVHQIGKEWDTSFVLIFPLSNIPAGYKRGDIERAIGNYLIDKKIPIIDFYSHNY